MGLLVGDGVLEEEKAVLSVQHTGGKGRLGIMNEALRCASLFPHRSDSLGWTAVPGHPESRLAMAALRDLAVSCGIAPGHTAITVAVEQGSSDFCRGFLRAFFDTDGSVQSTLTQGVSVCLSQTDLARLHAIQRMLLRLGMVSIIDTNRRSGDIRNLPDGTEGRGPDPLHHQHKLTVSGENLLRFHDLVGFSNTEKATKLAALLRVYRHRLNRECFMVRVKKIVEAGIEDVYDAQISGVHAFDANGFLAHNCGEQPLLPYESCTLGSINVGRFVKGPPRAPSIDYDRLARVIPIAVRFLDNVIDTNRYPLPEIETMTKNTRKIGLGIMGFADLLIKLGIPYDTDAALKTAEALMRFVQARAHAASAELAKERGVFPSFKGSRWEAEGQRLRNATVTTIAPTGTISIIANCSPGIEPLYGLSFVRTVMEDVRLVTVHPEFIRRLRAAGLSSATLLRRVGANESIRKLTDLPTALRRLFVTAHDIAPTHHVRMQAVFQKYSDSGVSKTINLPPSATKRDVASAFLLAYRLGCKGLTVFRSGSREGQVLSCVQIQYC